MTFSHIFLVRSVGLKESQHNEANTQTVQFQVVVHDENPEIFNGLTRIASRMHLDSFQLMKANVGACTPKRGG